MILRGRQGSSRSTNTVMRRRSYHTRSANVLISVSRLKFRCSPSSVFRMNPSKSPKWSKINPPTLPLRSSHFSRCSRSPSCPPLPRLPGKLPRNEGGISFA
jgi:hypothetical protein